MRLIRLSFVTCLLAAVLGACGAGRPAGVARTHSSVPPARARSANPPAFAWLRPAPAPSRWRVAHLSDSALLAYPGSWHRVHADAGTASAAQVDPHSDLIAGYLSATPQQGGETLRDWTGFRPAHNADEGDRDVRVLAAARGLAFRDGTGSCVVDRYRTSRSAYQEIACLVRGPRSTDVIVAAALAARWAGSAPALERAVSAFLA